MFEMFPERKRPATGVEYIDGQPTLIFDTICTKNRVGWLATEQVHENLRDVWSDSTAWLLGRYVIMPDHIHLFAWATGSAIKYKNWVTYWKSQFTKRNRDLSRKWQPGHWDTRMRTTGQYEEKWNYVRNNPFRHGLVQDADDWPYQGTLFDLRWDENNL